MCRLPPSGCCLYSPTLWFRMIKCVLPHAEVTEQAATAKQVDLHLPPLEEVVVHAVQEEAAHHHPSHTVQEADHPHHHPLHTNGDYSTPHRAEPGLVSPCLPVCDDVVNCVSDAQPPIVTEGK